MAIELPSKPDVLDERLTLLEDPSLAERLFRENPALFAHEPPRTEREVLAWTTRRFGTALLAVTAALSITAGYFGYSLSRDRAAAPQAAPHAAAVTVPVRQAPPVVRHAVSTRPPAYAAVASPQLRQAQHHAIAPVQRHATAPVRQNATAPATQHASAPVQHHTSVPVAVYHAAPVRVAHTTAPSTATHAAAHRNAALSAHVTPPARVVQPARIPAPAAAPQTAAAQLAAWEATHPATHARPRTDTGTDPAARTQPRTEPATATQTATTTATTTEPTGAVSVPPGVPDQGPSGGVKTPPTSPGGIWTERPPVGGVLGDGHGPIIGAPRDPCTPRGGRTGIVMQAISILASGRH
jgi:hypothetical protein